MIVPKRAFLVGFVLLISAGSYAAIPSAASSRPAAEPVPVGMVLGHVPTASATTSATIVIGPNAAIRGYTTKSVTISRGASLKVVNNDHMSHTVTSEASNSAGKPLFDVAVAAGTTVTVTGASALAAGKYNFYCRIHPSMRGTLTVQGKPGGTHPVATRFLQPLRLPKVLTGSHITIPIERKNVRVLPTGPLTTMWTYGGSYPGVTIRRPTGHDTKVTFVNHLPKSVGSLTVHLHGDHHSSADDGQPTTQLIGPGKKRTYDYRLTDAGKPERAAFDFYHDHRMGETGSNDWNGLQGMFITDDSRSRALKLPSGKYDVPLLISDRGFTAKNQLTEPISRTSPMAMKGTNAPPGDGTVGTRILVDGRYAPYFKVSTHRYRLRLLNASNFQSYDFVLSDGRSFRQVGTGSGLLPRTVVRKDILLGPAQRADVIVDFAGEHGKQVVLKTVPRLDHSPRGIGTPSASLMQFRVTKRVKDVSHVPSRLQPAPKIAVAKSSFTWSVGLGGNSKSGAYWTINGKPFDPKRVDVRVPLGATRTWTLRNNTSVTHFIHIHEEQWRTVSRDGKQPPPWERGLEDTWRLDPGEYVKVAGRFTDYTGVFMIHCHMLDHEDHGMMAQFAVVRRSARALPKGFYLASSRAATYAMGSGTGMSMKMPMSGSVTAARPAASGAASAAMPSGWSRIAVRSAQALALELVLLALVIAVRRYRRRRPRTG